MVRCTKSINEILDLINVIQYTNIHSLQRMQRHILVRTGSEKLSHYNNILHSSIPHCQQQKQKREKIIEGRSGRNTESYMLYHGHKVF